MILSEAMSRKCETCEWFDASHPRLKGLKAELKKVLPGIENPGFCRKHKPGGFRVGHYVIGCQPVMDADEYCGEYRPRKGQDDGLSK